MIDTLPQNGTIEVRSDNVQYSEDEILSRYSYDRNRVDMSDGKVVITPEKHEYVFKTERQVPRMGLMLVGWGGNNGSTVTAGVLANRGNVSWETKEGTFEPNYYGSITQCSTVRIGVTDEGADVNVPLKNLLPMVDPNDLVIGGWDISGMNLKDAMKRGGVLEYDLQVKLGKQMESMVPLPSIYYPDFIAGNQSERADNVIPGDDKQAHLEHIRNDIRTFKETNNLDKVIVLWTANTERFTDVREGLNMTADDILNSIRNSESEVSPSNVFAVASILEGCSYINGSPQNTITPGIVELAQRHGVFVGGDDFKSGQTKMKSVLMDFLVSAGLKVESIASYNHLGNNDGFNLTAPAQFRSKEISKSNVVDDMVASNQMLYKDGEKPDHCVVIKYMPFVGDSKRALDEYTSTIFMNGKNTISMHNTCEDSLLATPLILDLAILTELMERITYKTCENGEFMKFDAVCSILSYMLKAPMVRQGAPVVNALFKQQRCIQNVLRACIGLPPDNDMQLEHRTNLPPPAKPAM